MRERKEETKVRRKRKQNIKIGNTESNPETRDKKAKQEISDSDFVYVKFDGLNLKGSKRHPVYSR
jgi:hypothetical protein